MMKNEITGVLEPFDFDNLYKHIPVLRNYPVQIDFYSFNPLIDSSDMTPDFWIKLANIIEEKYESYDGFVVLHGTDTMAYTASMLSFMLENLNKPVILTGSQLPLGMLRTDGRENFIASIEIAAAQKDDTPIVPEVCVYFENHLYRGNRVTKVDSKNFNAFMSGNYPSLAEVGIEVKYNYQYIQKPNFKRLKVNTQLDDNIAILKLFPGITRNVVHTILNIPNLKGAILETFGAGNAPTADWFLDEMQEAINRNVIIFNVSQCKEGGVNTELYATGLKLAETGVIGGKDITTEAAIAKMMFLFGKEYSLEEVKTKLSVSMRGEMA